MGVCAPSAERISFISHGECLILRCFYLPLKSHDLGCAGIDVLLDEAERDAERGGGCAGSVWLRACLVFVF